MAGGRHVSSTIKVFYRNSLLCFFAMTSLIFLISWLFILRSTTSEATSSSSNNDQNWLLNSHLFSTFDDSEERNNNLEPPFGNRAILVDSEPVVEPPHDTTEETSIDHSVKCSNINNEKVVLKVFMYDLPSEFHFSLLDWKPEGKNVIWPDIIKSKAPGYPGGLNLQHSIEYWLTLDILASEFPESFHSGTAIRVRNSTESDVIFVPFFSSLTYNRLSRIGPGEKRSRNRELQEKLVKYVTAQDEWKRSGGSDHVILAHHPNSMMDARSKLWPATFILSDFGRYPPNIANVGKDVIAPYKHVIGSYVNDSSTFDTRPTLLYFQGAIHRKDGGHVRQELFRLLKDEKDVHFASGTYQKGGARQATEGMRSSKFCLNIAGDTPSSNRLFDAIASHCVPVIISDEIELPYEDVLDYSEFCIFVRTRDALTHKFLINFIRSIGRDEWTRMWNKLKEVETFYDFQFPSKESDAVQMIWQAVARKVPLMKLKTNRSRRFFRSLNGTKEMSLNSLPKPLIFS